MNSCEQLPPSPFTSSSEPIHRVSPKAGRCRIASLLGIVTGVALTATTAGYADSGHHGQAERHHHRGPLLAPPHSEAYGKSLAEWLSLYWRWYFGAAQDPAQSVIEGSR